MTLVSGVEDCPLKIYDYYVRHQKIGVERVDFVENELSLLNTAIIAKENMERLVWYFRKVVKIGVKY